MLRRLAELVPKLEETARVVVFRSSDARFFCAGADMERIANPSARDALELESQVVFDKLARAAFLSVAVVEGAAVGGGFEWALACDIRVAGPSCRMFFPETSLGLIPSAGGCTRFTATVGIARAKQVGACGVSIARSIRARNPALQVGVSSQ
jgi:enoyl-CoA hydratase/carnithine racemase